MTDWEEALNIISEYLEENAKRPKVAYLCKDKGTEYCHHTKHIEQARNFEKVGPNQWMEKEPKHGEWKPGREISRMFMGDKLLGIQYEDFSCSCCGMVIEEGKKPVWHFCPNCGADMREGDAE